MKYLSKLAQDKKGLLTKQLVVISSEIMSGVDKEFNSDTKNPSRIRDMINRKQI